jgi:hypothetical protein
VELEVIHDEVALARCRVIGGAGEGAERRDENNPGGEQTCGSEYATTLRAINGRKLDHLSPILNSADLAGKPGRAVAPLHVLCDVRGVFRRLRA